jgi:hypothetical protein
LHEISFGRGGHDESQEDLVLQRITLHLARTPEFPDGSAARGYEIVAPLDRTGHLDPLAWHDNRARCQVRRFWSGEPDRIGHLVHKAGGSGGATWAIDYDDAAGDSEEQGYHLNTHRFVEGEYVSIRDHKGEPVPFKVWALHRA